MKLNKKIIALGGLTAIPVIATTIALSVVYSAPHKHTQTNQDPDLDQHLVVPARPSNIAK